MVDLEIESVFVARSIAVTEEDEDEEPVWLELGRELDLDVDS